jgi:prephenate dehydrogenase
MARRTKPVNGVSAFQESGDFRDPRPVVGIVGGRGRMGSWFAALMERQGLTVLRSDRRTDLSPAAMTAQCDVVVISVPIAETLKVIRELGPLVSEHGLLMDLTSVKKAPLETMLACSTAQVVSVVAGARADSPGSPKCWRRAASK